MGQLNKTWKTHTGKIVHEKSDQWLIDCEPCGFKHLVPLPDLKAWNDFYKDSFYEDYWGNFIKDQLEEIDWLKIEHNEKYDTFETFLPPGRRKLLDVGSGPGFFIQTGSERGWNTVGVEPAKAAWKYATEELGAEVLNRVFDEESIQQLDEFDVIHFNNVLEHLPDPMMTLSLTNQILSNGGLICITAPNDFNPLQDAVVDYCKKEPYWIDIREHLNYFDLDSLENLLRRMGFVPIYHTSSFPLELFILMGDDYVEDPSVGKVIHQKRKKFEMAMAKIGRTDLKRKMYTELCRLGMGRQITVIAKKSE